MSEKPKENNCHVLCVCLDDQNDCCYCRMKMTNRIMECQHLITAQGNLTACTSSVAQVNALTVALQTATGLTVRLLTKEQAEKVDKMLKSGS